MPHALAIKLAAEILLPLAEKVVEKTDNEFDDALIRGLEYLANVDSNLR